ncbi:PEP-CTERM sorting domain-containing protein [Methylomonas fluvii]|uniref:PEP-CTERM sorting domain-containing protein n=1 Tax=Methylomonas fluvii TaxID=1854564 RepID=A0ABR9DB01_9GAMM|nr:PEP-CTERM sorting domain-containing protein [Methylomonas fluvii]MBD9360287.1 PEP-CTERM sorting domain-containing protein [Methylomonas fluvii]
MNSVMPKMPLSGLILILTLFTQAAESATVIDNFTNRQSTTNTVNGPVSVSGSDLNNLQRTLNSSPTPGGTTRIFVEDGLLTVGNSSNSTGTASIFYNFAAVDFTTFANAILLTTESSDATYQIQMIANGTSLLSFQNLTSVAIGSPSTIRFDFSQFSNPAAFKNLNTLELKLRGTNAAWDADFSQLSTVPEPSVTALLIIGALGIVGGKRQKLVAV